MLSLLTLATLVLPVPYVGVGLIKLQGGRILKHKRRGLTIDRQLCGAINIYLKVCGFFSFSKSTGG
ncbi:MAG: hypothetical protein G5Z42_02865 [Caldisphaeraceae archaeon]|nr:hypothetical protein [Caldisphaeraceae archaeon]